MDSIAELTLGSIGLVEKKDGAVKITVGEKYGSGLEALADFGHVLVVWWAHLYVEFRHEVDMVIDLPYAPGIRAGLFATRSPVRPNPVCVSVAEIVEVSPEDGYIVIDEIDAVDQTPVIDIKPYYGTCDRVEDYRQPDWVPDEWPVWRVPISEEDYTSEEEA